MKRLFLMLMSLGWMVSAQAGEMKFTCKNDENSLVITRDKMVLLQKEGATKHTDLVVLTNRTVNAMPAQNQVLEFESELNKGTKIGDLRISAISTRKPLAGDESGTCQDGHGAGFSTEAYKVRGQLSLFGKKAKTVELSCVEFSSWSGTCDEG